MKILVVVSDFPKVTETFAISNILHYLAMGHDVTLFHLKSYRKNEVLHDEAKPVAERAFTYPWVSGRSLSGLAHAIVSRPTLLARVVFQMIGAFWREPKRLAASLALLPKAIAMGRHAREVGVEHIHAEFASHPATMAWIAHRLYGLPFSFSAHMHDIFVSQSLLAVKSQDARFVRTISEYNVQKLLAVVGFDAEKLRLVRCGVDLCRFGEQIRNAAYVGSRFEIVFVGSLFERKGCALLLEVLKRFGAREPWHLTIIGDGPERAKIAGMVSSMPDGRVSMLGAQSSDVVQKQLGQAHLMIAPSFEAKGGRSEGIPVVLMEAMASGCPVIASRISGIPELVSDGVSGTLIQPGNSAELEASIRKVIRDYPMALKMAKMGRRRIESEYNIKRNAQVLLNLMESST